MKQAKQVIVIRKDLKMRRGKEIAQGSHASCAFLVDGFKMGFFSRLLFLLIGKKVFSKAEQYWMFNGSFKKICVVVNSEEELLQIKYKAYDKGLTCKPIIDSGLTEFNGVPTLTCLAIGPHYDEDFVGVTDKLKLY